MPASQNYTLLKTHSTETNGKLHFKAVDLKLASEGIVEAFAKPKLTQKQASRINWKNAVRHYYEGSTLASLKAFVKLQIEKEERDVEEWKIRNSPAFKAEVLRRLGY